MKANPPCPPGIAPLRIDQNMKHGKGVAGLTLMIMKHKISSSIRSLVTGSGTARRCLARLEITFMRFAKADAAPSLNKLANMKYDDLGNVRDHIGKMSGLAARVQAGGVDMPDFFVVRLVLDSLPPPPPPPPPPQYERFQASYDVNRGLEELMCMRGARGGIRSALKE